VSNRGPIPPNGPLLRPLATQCSISESPPGSWPPTAAPSPDFPPFCAGFPG